MLMFASWWVVSLLPLRLLYVLADALFFPLYYVVRYRRKVVRRNLWSAFPEKDAGEIARIERGFYHYFCDTMVETLKSFSIRKQNLMRRMTFEGIDEMVADMERQGKTFSFVYLGHYGNWEWIASLQYWVPQDYLCAQIYHPLYNKAFDRLFLRLRNRYGGECIPMKETLRRIIRLRQEKRKTIIGFISDQAPKWNSIHHWTDFLHHDTPVFTGTEKIGKQVDAVFYYTEVTRPRRGEWKCSFHPMTDADKHTPDFQITDQYIRLLEQMIQQAPQFWLWSHNRWKRTRERWEELKREGKV
jgi:KDO2-lipid IV(A) lauroyltransferase